METLIKNNLYIEEYHKNKDYISFSGLKHARRNLKDYLYYLTGGYDKDYRSCFDFGNAFELALTDERAYYEKVIDDKEICEDILLEDPTVKSCKRTKKYKEWKEQNKGKYIISDEGEESREYLNLMVKSCLEDNFISSIIQDKKNLIQQSLYWFDIYTKLKLKTRPDILNKEKRIIVDIKTTIDGSPHAFSNSLAKFSYPLQAIMQIEGAIKSKLMEQVDFYFWLVVEKKPPFSSQLYEFEKNDRLTAMDDYHNLLTKVSEAMKESDYKDYKALSDNNKGVLRANIPQWYYNQF